MTSISNRSQSTGKKGEELALQYLTDKHYIIQTTNYRCLYGEIDIVASIGKTLVFVEVKTRKSNTYGQAVEAYTRLKQQKIIKTAWSYLDKHYPENLPRPFFRFDLIALQLDYQNNIKELNHYENAISW